jgi:uncharacterized Zn finger protein (UPF0148 family)
MQCKNCNYPVFAYSRCCPNCGRAVAVQNPSQSSSKVPQTRLDFLIAGIRKTVIPGKVRRPA